MLRDTVRGFAFEKIAPRAAEIDEKDEFPIDLWPAMGELGLQWRGGDEEYGGANMGYLAHYVGDGGDQPRLGLGRPVLRRPLQPLHEPDPSLGHARAEAALPARIGLRRACRRAGDVRAQHGSDVVSMRLRADKKGDQYVLNGSKLWITNGHYAETIVVYAKTDPAAGPRGITAFLIEKGFKGSRPAQKLDKLGMRGSPTSELVFEDCAVPEENVLGEVGKGVNVLMSGLDYERAVLAAGPLGIMQAALDVALPYVHDRKQFDTPIGEFQLVQGKLADIYTRLNASRAYVYAVARACDRGQTTRKDAAGAILFAAEAATQVALDAIQLLGGNGYINEYPTGRLLRDAKLYEIGAGTSEIRRMLIGRELFKESA